MPGPQIGKHVQIDMPLGEGAKAEALIISTLGKSWRATYLMKMQRGVPVIAQLLIEPQGSTVPPGGLSARLLRTLKFTLPRKELKALRELRRKYPPIEYEGKFLSNPLLETEAKAPHTEHKGGRPDLFYARIAQQYCKLLESGAKNPALTLAKERNEAPGNVRYMLWRARKRGLLDPVTKGRAGGDLTTECLELLKSSHPKIQYSKRQKERKR